MYGDRFDTECVTGAKYSQRNFTPVGNDDFF
jgi:hypothetical protein